MKKNVFVILTIVVLSLFVIGCNETMIEPIETEEPTEDIMEETETPPVIEEPEVMEETKTEAPVAEETQEEKVIKITGENYKFMINEEENPEIKVKIGEKIKIEFTSTEGFHDFVIDELNAKTDRVTSGKSTSIEFVADKTGTFSYYCSVGNHRSAGMEGTFVVE